MTMRKQISQICQDDDHDNNDDDDESMSRTDERVFLAKLKRQASVA